MGFLEPTIMNLTNIDYIDISHNICDNEDTNGLAVYEKDGETLHIRYYLQTESYEDGDHYNGTGAIITNKCDFCIKDYILYDEQGFEKHLNLDANLISKLVNKYTIN